MQYFLYCDIIPKLLKKLKGKEGIKVFMIKRLYACVREYRLATWLTPLFILGEAVIECLIPYRIANLINNLNDYGVVLESIIKDGLILAAYLRYMRRDNGGKSRFGICKKSAPRYV